MGIGANQPLSWATCGRPLDDRGSPRRATAGTALNLVGRSVYVADGAPWIFRKKRIFGQDLGQA